MIEYKLITTKVVIEDKTVNTYGIVCEENDKITQCIQDVSSDKNFVLKTIKNFNENKLAPEHFFDAIEDSII